MVSIVIPALNEERALPGTLEALLRQEGDFEVILVDGGSQDRTWEIAESSGRVRLLRAPKGRASQMNAGAAVASGEWLLFLHADTQLPLGAIAQLHALERDESIRAGGFRHRFSGTDWRLRAISWLDNVRCARSRVIYGDQALFVRRVLFQELGGFPLQPILEDVAFCERMLTQTRPILLGSAVVTDARKFVAMGIGRSFLRVLLIILHVQFRLPVLPRVFFQDVR
jgi:rSAM/selenodomain-associated transferase 2